MSTAMFCAQRLVTNKMYSSGLMDRLETHKKKKKLLKNPKKKKFYKKNLQVPKMYREQCFGSASPESKHYSEVKTKSRVKGFQ